MTGCDSFVFWQRFFHYHLIPGPSTRAVASTKEPQVNLRVDRIFGSLKKKNTVFLV